jgi:hypothetical protein
MSGSGPDGGQRRWRLRTWSPDYEQGSRPDGDALRAPQVDAASERPVAAWAPLGSPVGRSRADPGGGGRGPVGSGAARDLPPIAFVDGVQRVDAWADVEADLEADLEGDLEADQEARDDTIGEALFASYLAGAVVAGGGTARYVPPPPVCRAVFGAGPGEPIAGYRRIEAEGRPEDALQAARDALEVAVASSLVQGLEHHDGVLVLDGPLHGRGHVPRALGLVKSHRVDYLDHPDLRRVRSGLAAGQRTPLFSVDSGWVRWSWYVRVAGRERGWAGLVRCEASAQAGLDQAVELADLSAWALPCFASSPVKDPRAPQNLVPIGSLERWLRHRLGDREVLERRLRRALAAER